MDGATGEVFDEAHEVPFVLGGVVDDGGDHRVAEVADGFEASLSADEIVSCPVVFECSLVDGDGLFEADAGDVGFDGVERDAVAGSWVDDPDFRDGDGRDRWVGHAASGRSVGRARLTSDVRSGARYTSRTMPLVAARRQWSESTSMLGKR